MNARASLVVTVLGALAAAGVGLYAATRVWIETSHTRPAPLPPDVVTSTGVETAVWTVPCAVVALAAALALPAVSKAAREFVAGCLALAGVGLAAGGAYGMVEAAGVWPACTAVAGATVTVLAVWALRSGRRWPAMSARYERGGAPAKAAVADDPASLWDALDRGEDPTSLSIGQTAPGEECPR